MIFHGDTIGYIILWDISQYVIWVCSCFTLQSISGINEAAFYGNVMGIFYRYNGMYDQHYDMWVRSQHLDMAMAVFNTENMWIWGYSIFSDRQILIRY